MQSRLIIAEKPSVARDIAQALSIPRGALNCFESEAWVVASAWATPLRANPPPGGSLAGDKWNLNDLPRVDLGARQGPRRKTTAALESPASADQSKQVTRKACAVDHLRPARGQPEARLLRGQDAQACPGALRDSQGADLSQATWGCRMRPMSAWLPRPHEHAGQPLSAGPGLCAEKWTATGSSQTSVSLTDHFAIIPTGKEPAAAGRKRPPCTGGGV